MYKRIYTEKLDQCNKIMLEIENGGYIRMGADVLQIVYEYIVPMMNIFSKLTPSTLTAQGMLSNVKFEEKDLIFAVQPTGRITKITCNYGEIYGAEHVDVSKEKKTNRGRTPKKKNKTTRKNQGNGKYFNSQISFWVSAIHILAKYYKVKLFRNGTVKVPGGLDPSMCDVRDAVTVVADILSDILVEDVHIVELYSIMRNYKFEIIDKNVRVNTNRLHEIFINEYNAHNPVVDGIIEIKFNIERYPGLIIKFSTPVPRNKNKQTTIKMFQSGKVNIDGAVSVESAEKYYEWLNEFYAMYEKEIMYTPLEVIDYSDSDSSES